MCFVLYVGTEKPLPRKAWDEAAPDLSVESLTEHDGSMRYHFSTPAVQYVGATSGCGCDFPHVTLQNEEWPIFEDDEEDSEWEATALRNREGLVAILRESGETHVELYGVWDGDYDEVPKAKESIPLEKILDPGFWFKEQGFYEVKI
jgi:hypothetical protein